ncbi:hypothetical protein OHU45_18910 [Streptomyces tubercidicus]|nr:hypothetical protein OG761_18705 [Streptomyces tubercidicus]WSX21600.1 hypothetical protein OG690_18380 [Streptomyces tubercidicus]
MSLQVLTAAPAAAQQATAQRPIAAAGVTRDSAEPICIPTVAPRG